MQVLLAPPAINAVPVDLSLLATANTVAGVLGGLSSDYDVETFADDDGDAYACITITKSSRTTDLILHQTSTGSGWCLVDAASDRTIAEGATLEELVAALPT
jgi:hypothetical protein